MKRKSLTMILCLLTCLSLVGVGFAAWVISSGDTEVVSGNITVDTVSDKRFTFGETPTLTSIHFGMDDSSPISNAWLTNDVANSESLVATFEIELKSSAALSAATKEAWAAAVTVGASYSLAVTGTNPGENDADAVAAYNAAVAAKAIAVPETNLTVNYKESTTTNATYEVVVVFAWGEAFDTNRTTAYVKETNTAPSITDDDNLEDNLNPYTFYNTKAVGTWGDDAYYYLDLIQKLESLYYNVTVSATPNA